MINSAWKQWKRKWTPYFIAYGGKMLVKMLLKTCKVKIDGMDRFLATAKSSPCIIMLWHNKLVIVSEILHTSTTSDLKFAAFISKSRDGEPLAILAQSYSRGRALRVPHNTRHIALNKLIEALRDKREVVLVTPDGPRGPSNIIKPGIVVAARESAAAIVPFSWRAKRFWQLNTWDKMKIPKPFTTIHVTLGEGIKLPEDEDLERDTKMLTKALEKLEK